MYGSTSRWGNLTLLGFENRQVMATDADGTEYNTGATGPQIMILRCDCGHKFELEKRFFPGRRDMRNCGRRGECEYADGSSRDPEREQAAVEARLAYFEEKRNKQRISAEKRISDLHEVVAKRLPGRPRSSNVPGRNITIYLTGDEYEMVLEYAAKTRISVSRACGALIHAGHQRIMGHSELQSQAAIESTLEPDNKPAQNGTSRKRGKKLHL